MVANNRTENPEYGNPEDEDSELEEDVEPQEVEFGGSAQEESSFQISEDNARTRLDRWLAATQQAMSRTEAQRIIRAGQATVNRRTAKPSYLLEAGDVVHLRRTATPVELRLHAEPIPIEILYQDPDILVVDKPSGMVVHPAPGHESGTLVNALLYHCPDLGQIGGAKRPGIVHRLDKDTSGLILIAKHEQALRHLQQQFKTRTVEKEYLALVEGVPDPAAQTIDVPLGRHPVDRKRQAAFPPQMHLAGLRVRAAITTIQRKAVYSVPVHDANATGNFSLIAAYPKTGRTHQIRVHLAWIKHPIVGDPLYGLTRQRLAVPRLFLHAHRLRIALPSSQSAVEFTSPLPPDLRTLLERLETAT